LTAVQQVNLPFLVGTVRGVKSIKFVFNYIHDTPSDQNLKCITYYNIQLQLVFNRINVKHSYYHCL